MSDYEWRNSKNYEQEKNQLPQKIDFPNYLENQPPKPSLKADESGGEFLGALEEPAVFSPSFLPIEKDYSQVPFFQRSFEGKKSEEHEIVPTLEAEHPHFPQPFKGFSSNHTRVPFRPKRLPDIQPKGSSYEDDEAYQRAKRELLQPKQELLLFSMEETSLVSESEAPTIQKRTYNPKPRRLFEPSNSHKNQSVQGNLLSADFLSNDIPFHEQKQVDRQAVLSNRKAKKAMNRSLSWIMEQNRETNRLPYSAFEVDHENKEAVPFLQQHRMTNHNYMGDQDE